VDEFIVFEPLIRSQIRDIVGLRATALVARVAAQHITLKLGDSALEYLAAKVCRIAGAACETAIRTSGMPHCTFAQVKLPPAVASGLRVDKD
jgi:hypothetical protein